MPWFPNPSGGPPIQADTNPNPAGGSYGSYSDPSYSGPPPGGGGAPSAPNPGPATNNPYLANTGGLAQFAAQTSGVTQAQLAQQKAEFDAQLAFAKDQMVKLGIPQLQINQQLAQLQQQQFQSQLSLAQQAQQYNQAATTAGLTGWFNAPPNVPNIAPQFGGMGQGQGGTGGGAAAGGLQPGSFVKKSNNEVGQVQPNGQIVGFGSSEAASAAGVAPGWTNVSPIADTLFDQLVSAPPAQGGMGEAGVMPTVADFGKQSAQEQQAWTAAHGAGAADAWAQAATQRVQQFQTENPTATSWTLGGATGALQQGQPTGAGGTAPGGAQQTLQGQLQQAQLTGMYQGAPTEQASEFTRQLGLQQGQLGQQYLATAAQLQGPQNTFQLSNYLRGAQGNQAVPTYLQNLASNIGNPMFQGAGTTAPTTQTAAGLAGQLGGTTSATPGWDYNQTLGAIQGMMSRGAQNLRPGALEGLTPDELQALGSGIGAAGGSLPSFLQQYQQSRIGQGAATGTPTLA